MAQKQIMGIKAPRKNSLSNAPDAKRPSAPYFVEPELEWFEPRYPKGLFRSHLIAFVPASQAPLDRLRRQETRSKKRDIDEFQHLNHTILRCRAPANDSMLARILERVLYRLFRSSVLRKRMPSNWCGMRGLSSPRRSLFSGIVNWTVTFGRGWLATQPDWIGSTTWLWSQSHMRISLADGRSCGFWRIRL